MVAFDLNPDRRTLRGFSRIWFPLFVVALGSILRWRLGWTDAATVTWVAGAGLAIAGLASVRAARLTFVVLTVVTYPVALVTSTVLLSVMYYVVMTPLGLWLRLRGHDPLQRRGRGAASHWRPYEQDDDARRATRQF